MAHNLTGRQRLATLSIDTTIRFRSAADRAAFTRDVSEAVTSLVALYHDETNPRGRDYRVMLAAHPVPPSSEDVK